jgi:hypothetical protein
VGYGKRDTAALVARARTTLSAGRPRAALGEAWDAANASLRAGDDESLAAAGALALEIGGSARGRTRRSAETLHSFCTHSLTDARASNRRGSLFDQLFGRKPKQATRPCPGCAAHVEAAARFCPSCGRELDA